ncbi:hypothetical protein [Streptomyces sp. NPDC007074]
MTAQEFSTKHGDPTTWTDDDYELYWLLTETGAILPDPKTLTPAA